MIPDGAHLREMDWTIFFRPVTALTGLLCIPQLHPCVASGEANASAGCICIVSFVRTKWDEHADR